MLYQVIGLMSGSSLDGLDIAYVHLHEVSGKWSYQIAHHACYAYPPEWMMKLQQAAGFTALDYQLLHIEYGHYLGQLVNRFISEKELSYQVQLIASHGHTIFHVPEKQMTAQLGDGASIAAVTGIDVISDLRAMDMAFAGQGAPIVPIGEKLLFNEYELFLNLGGIANISAIFPQASLEELSKLPFSSRDVIAFDVCSANKILNMLCLTLGKQYDDKGDIAASGSLNTELLARLNALPFYKKPHPKSLANEFGTGLVYEIIMNATVSVADALRTYVEHICLQIKDAFETIRIRMPTRAPEKYAKNQVLATGGGIHNYFLITRLRAILEPIGLEVIIPSTLLADYKEALIMALIGTLRWRHEINTLASVTGASRDTIGGAIWLGRHD